MATTFVSPEGTFVRPPDELPHAITVPSAFNAMQYEVPASMAITFVADSGTF